eukprot:CAMPEP_0115613844 /NCGR_PEP_ID=MMETSP0272-20121206/21799_1 /TAXON_ID=71861 /ORGANISM="Scrippsiella trochoidea, Strain CCMP3099" /LENGTH=408 /DNA_ID=CAMNT_0003049703 /DNA_START=86 /DNA_END=1311 /DNA_ORIENTATION=-
MISAAGVLELIPHTQHPQQAQWQKDHHAEARGPNRDEEACEELRAELIAAVECPVPTHSLVWVSEEAQCQDAPEAAYPVNWEGVHHIVNPELLQQHRGALVEQAAHDADHDRLPRLNVGAAGGDRHEACQDPIAEAAHVQELRAHNRGPQEKDEQTADARRQRGVHGNESGNVGCSLVVHRACAARVEAVPAKPQEEGTKTQSGMLVPLEMRFRLWVVSTLPGPDNDSAAERPDSAHHVHEPAACEVNQRRPDHGLAFAGLIGEVEHPAAAPAPINDDGVDDGCHQDREGDEALQLRALCHRTAHNGAPCSAEGSLEEPEPERVLVRPEPSHVEACAACKLVAVLHSTEGQGVAHHVPTEEADRHNDQILREDVLCVLEAHGPRFQQAEARVHEEHKSRCQQHPNRVQ